MADLRRALTEAGLEEVSSYIQSGNVVFGGSPADPEALIAEIIDNEFGLEVPVVVRSGAEIEDVVGALPYGAEAKADPTKVHVVFLGPGESPDWTDVPTGPEEELTVGDGVVYVHLPHGMGRSKLAAELAKSTKKMVTTTRNWRTVVAIEEMLSD